MHTRVYIKLLQAIKDWMLLIMVAIIVGLEMVVIALGKAIPASRLIANATLINERRQNTEVRTYVRAHTVRTY